jgi:pimeloyl-ACP methyl ester carboxylesterase
VRLDVPLDYDKPGATLSLHVTVAPALRESARRDPLFILAGGPGEAGSDLVPLLNAAFRKVRATRDVVLIDQRGTGKLGTLACRDSHGKDMTLPDSAETDAAAIADFAGRCAQALQGKADPRLYTTTEAVGDLETVRRALAVDRINLVGVSYGTRVAQQYAARHPQHTRAIVLDGVAPNTLVVGGEFAQTFERALRLQSAHCQKLASCRQRFPQDLRSQLLQLRTRLEAAPVEVEYRDPSTGETRRDTLTADTVVGLSQLFSYMPQMASLLPVVIDDAGHGRYAPLMALAQMMSREVGGQMTRGMQWSVICSEDADRYRANPADAGTVLGPALAPAFFAACKHWPHGQRPAGFNQPLRSPVPALLMSGEIDPVTPPDYAESVLKGLPNGRHVVLRGQGHNVGGIGCMPKLVGQFIESADAKKLDTKCLDAIGYVPPFTGFNGWEP